MCFNHSRELPVCARYQKVLGNQNNPVRAFGTVTSFRKSHVSTMPTRTARRAIIPRSMRLSRSSCASRTILETNISAGEDTGEGAFCALLRSSATFCRSLAVRMFFMVSSSRRKRVYATDVFCQRTLLTLLYSFYVNMR